MVMNPLVFGGLGMLVSPVMGMCLGVSSKTGTQGWAGFADIDCDVTLMGFHMLPYTPALLAVSTGSSYKSSGSPIRLLRLCWSLLSMCTLVSTSPHSLWAVGWRIPCHNGQLPQNPW
jgi:hypothetical protein